MEKFVTEAATTYWWITAGVGLFFGILGNILSGPIIRGLSWLLSAFSSKWRARSKASAEMEAKRLQALIDDPVKIEGERDRIVQSLALSALVLFLTGIYLAFVVSDGSMYLSEPKKWAALAPADRHYGAAFLMLMASIGELSRALTRSSRVLCARKALGHLLD